MRIVFMGTPEFSVPTLKALAAAGYEITGVITQPDKPKGRGKTMQLPAVKEAAIALDIPVYQPQKVREPQFVEILQELNPELIIVVAFGQILPKTILDLPAYGCVNVHASLLPKYRGAAPIQWAVIDGEKVSGVTTMQMAEGLDTGDMIMKTEIALDPKETGGSLHDKLAVAGAELCVKTVAAIQNGTAQYEVQNDAGSSYARMLDKNLGNLDWTMAAEQLECLIRGLNPWPSAYTSYNGKGLKIWAASVVDDEAGGEAGEIVTVTKKEIRVRTGKGILQLEELQLAGKKRMSAAEFLRGCKMKAGEVLKKA